MPKPTTAPTSPPGKGAFSRFMSAGIAADTSTEERRLLSFHRLAVTSFVWIAPVSIVTDVLLGTTHLLVMHLVQSIVFGAPLVLTLTGRHTASKVVYTYGTIGVMAYTALLQPGFDLVWFLVFSMVYAQAVFRGDERWLRRGAVALCLGAFTWFQINPEPTSLAQVAEMSAADHELGRVFTAMMATFAIAIVVGFMASSTRAAEAHLQTEHEKSERLLLNILPEAIADRLKTSPETIADGFDSVTVFFSDIVGFTPMSEKLSPPELVGVLNKLFTAFDRIAAEYGLEKIKTIGDAYMVAGGLPVESADHARAVAGFALKARDFAIDFGSKLDPPLGIRIGLHSGPVVAGVIGESKFAYDLWGDTVNTASRMESSGESGKIQISEATAKLLGDDFQLVDRGLITVKGKGQLRTYFLQGRRNVG